MKRIIAVILAAAILCAVLLTCTPLLKNRSQDVKYADYFDTPERYDIVFLGSSHVIMGNLPLELWKDYGLSSYNLANYGQLIQADYWLLKLILTKAAPKLVVVDLYSAQYDDVFNDANSDYMHGLMDCFPFSRLKYDAIMDIFPEDMRGEYFFPLNYYHSRWNRIDRENFSDPKETYFFGQGSDESAFYGISAPVLVRPYSNAGTIDKKVERTDTLGKDYLRKIIELCRENNIDVMCTVVPFLPYDDDMKWVNSAVEIAEEYNVPVCSGMNGDTILDPRTDMFDYGHLNSSGARKWTDVLGKFISENFDLPEYVSGDTFDFWQNEYYEKYIPFKAEKLSEQKVMYNYLMLCADKNLSVCLYLPSGSEVFSNRETLDLIRNLCGGEELPVLSEQNGDEDYFLCADKVTGKIYESSDTDISFETAAGFGEICFGGRTLSVNGVQAADWIDHSLHEVNSLQLGIAVFNNTRGDLMNTKWFFKAENGTFGSLT